MATRSQDLTGGVPQDCLKALQGALVAKESREHSKSNTFHELYICCVTMSWAMGREMPPMAAGSCCARRVVDASLCPPGTDFTENLTSLEKSFLAVSYGKGSINVKQSFYFSSIPFSLSFQT